MPWSWGCFCCLVLAAIQACNAASLLPVFLMHGIGDNHNEFDQMEGWIKAIDPNVSTYSIPVCDDSASYTNLWNQGDQIVSHIRTAVSNAPAGLYDQGYALLCHSQGALTCRTVIERMDDHRVHTFISLAGPQMGEFGIPQGWDKKLPWGRDLVYAALLTGPTASAFQKDLSIANFWNDPRPTDGLFGKPAMDYLSGNSFLPVLNNNPARRTQGPGKPKDDEEAARYKRNFMRLERAVFTASPVDDMIIPYDSALFRFYNSDASATVPLEDSPLWQNDWIGLRALNANGKIEFVTADNVCHTCWAHNETVFKQHIAPYLPHHNSAQ